MTREITGKVKPRILNGSTAERIRMDQGSL